MITVGELSKAIGGRLLSGCDAAEQRVGRVAIDTRRLSPGEVFWALRGAERDGAMFVPEAFERGASGTVVAADVHLPADRWAIRVVDTQNALWRAARLSRSHFRGLPIAVTGSVGKTTTRQMIDTVLQTHLSGFASPRNYNNHIGLPLSLLGTEPEHEYAVFELGASRRGEIAALAGLCAPKLGVITQIGDAHLASFGGRKNIALAKAELLAALPADGHAILGEDPWLRNVARHCRVPTTWVGTGDECDLQATGIVMKRGWLLFHAVWRERGEAVGHLLPEKFRSHFAKEPFRAGASPCPFQIPVWGRHHLTAALCAIATGRLLGFSLEEIAAALRHYRPVAQRCEVSEIRGVTVINDTYNACPAAMRAALELMRDLDTRGRRIAVLGDMGELGRWAPQLHWKLGRQAVAIGKADLLIACGHYARYVVDGARAAGLPQAQAIASETFEPALTYLGEAIVPGSLVLVKGSRRAGMERIVEALNQSNRKLRRSRRLCGTTALPFPPWVRGIGLPDLAVTGSTAPASASRWGLRLSAGGAHSRPPVAQGSRITEKPPVP